MDGIEYNVYKKGIAIVNKHYGNADVSSHESCEYVEYISRDQKNKVSIKKWDGKIERERGEYIDVLRVKIRDEYEEEKIKNEKIRNKSSVIIFYGLCLFLAIPILSVMLPELLVNKSIGKYLEKQTKVDTPKYTYITTLTNDVNDKEAKVYQSTLTTIDAVVKDIVDGVPEGITEIVDTNLDTEEDGVGIHTRKDFAYIYFENGVIYIQVSRGAYVNAGGALYHSNHQTNYEKTYHNIWQSTKYSSSNYFERNQLQVVN